MGVGPVVSPTGVVRHTLKRHDEGSVLKSPDGRYEELFSQQCSVVC